MVLDAVIAPLVIAGNGIGAAVTFVDQHFWISTEFDQHPPNRLGALCESATLSA